MIRSVPAALAALALALASAGCGGDAGPAPVTPPPPPSEFKGAGACDMVAARGSCMAFAGMSEVGVSGQVNACRLNGGSNVAACPATADLGACLIPASVGLALLHLYEPQWTAADGPFLCGSGAWVPAGAAEEGPAPFEVSCRDPFEGTCHDVSGTATPTLRLALERNCTGNDLTLLAGPCPAAGRTGTCTTGPAGLTWRDHHYLRATLAEDRATCYALGGSWAVP